MAVNLQILSHRPAQKVYKKRCRGEQLRVPSSTKVVIAVHRPRVLRQTRQADRDSLKNLRCQGLCVWQDV